MANPFKVGDKVVRRPEWATSSGLWVDGDKVLTVTSANYYGTGEPSVRLDGVVGTWDAARFRAAIAGQDYPAPLPVFPAERANGAADQAHYAGHLPDGSSVQKHSAGPLYPCVLVLRDGTLGGKYDHGVISPRNQEPLWFSNHEAAVFVAEIIKKDLT